MEYHAKVFESSSCDKDGRTKGVHVWPIEEHAVVLQISGFPSSGVSGSFDDLSVVHGTIFLNRENAVRFAEEILQATRCKEATTITYDFIPETWT